MFSQIEYCKSTSNNRRACAARGEAIGISWKKERARGKNFQVLLAHSAVS